MGNVLPVDQGKTRDVYKSYDRNADVPSVEQCAPEDIVGRYRARNRALWEDAVDKQSILVLQDALASCYRQFGAQTAPYKCRDVAVEYLRRIAPISGWGGFELDHDLITGKKVSGVSDAKPDHPQPNKPEQ